MGGMIYGRSATATPLLWAEEVAETLCQRSAARFAAACVALNFTVAFHRETIIG